MFVRLSVPSIPALNAKPSDGVELGKRSGCSLHLALLERAGAAILASSNILELFLTIFLLYIPLLVQLGA